MRMREKLLGLLNIQCHHQSSPEVKVCQLYSCQLYSFNADVSIWNSNSKIRNQFELYMYSMLYTLFSYVRHTVTLLCVFVCLGLTTLDDRFEEVSIIVQRGLF